MQPPRARTSLHHSTTAHETMPTTVSDVTPRGTRVLDRTSATLLHTPPEGARATPSSFQNKAPRLFAAGQDQRQQQNLALDHVNRQDRHQHHRYYNDAALYHADAADAAATAYAPPRAENDREACFVQTLKRIRDEVGSEEDKLALLNSRRQQGEVERAAAEQRLRDTEAEVDALELRLSGARKETDHLRRKLALERPRAAMLQDEVLALRVRTFTTL